METALRDSHPGRLRRGCRAPDSEHAALAQQKSLPRVDAAGGGLSGGEWPRKTRAVPAVAVDGGPSSVVRRRTGELGGGVSGACGTTRSLAQRVGAGNDVQSMAQQRLGGPGGGTRISRGRAAGAGRCLHRHRWSQATHLCG